MPEALLPDRLRLRLFGPLQILRGDVSLPTPASRKTRAILGYLALTPRPVSRQRLCELFFEMPDDPRASLRWSLTKLRPMVDAPGKVRLIGERDTVRLDLSDTEVDALQLQDLAMRELATVDQDECLKALNLATGDLLEDAELPDRPEYAAWLSAQREDFRNLTLSLTRRQADAAHGSDRITRLHQLMALDPLDETTAAALARALVEAGRRDKAHQLVTQTERQLQRAGLQVGPGLRLALRAEPPGGLPPKASSDPMPSTDSEGRICVAIIPFMNHSPVEVDDTLLDGLLEAVVHKLSKFRHIRVAGYLAALAFKGALRDPASMGRALGVGYLAGGSVMVADGALKIRYRLVSATNGELLASGDVDQSPADSGSILEDAPSQLAVLFEHHLNEIAQQEAMAIDPECRLPVQHFHVGMSLGLLATPVNYSAALGAFECGLKAAPEHPRLNAYALWTEALQSGFRPWSDTQAVMARVRRITAKADHDADALAIAACSALLVSQDFDTATKVTELATRLNPLSMMAWSTRAWVHAMAAEGSVALEYWKKADSCNPFGSQTDRDLDARSLCLWLDGRFAEAIEAAKRTIDRHPGHPLAHMVLIAAAIGLDDQTMVKVGADALQRDFPAVRDSLDSVSLPFRDRSHLARLQSALANASTADFGSPVGAQANAPREDRPCIAVLPFQDLSAEALPSHIAAGFLDGLTHALSRFRSLVVISAESTAGYAGRLQDPVTTARSLGADILVGGSVMAAADGRLRLRWRAIDGQAGHAVALGDTEGRLTDLWEFQEAAAAEIAIQVEPRAQIEALRNRQLRPTASSAAYELYLKGLFAGFGLEGRDYGLALDFFEQAIRLDPKFHPALAMAPWAAVYGKRVQSVTDLKRFEQMSRDALTHGHDDARTQATAGTALFYFAHDFKAARQSIERAITLNPNEYTAWICGGWMRAMGNEADTAHEMFDRAERLNPMAYGTDVLMSGRAMADFMAGRVESAERYIQQALACDESHPSALTTGIATAVELGLHDLCRARCRAFLDIYPDGLENFAIRALPFEDPSCRARYFESVAAGLQVGARA